MSRAVLAVKVVPGASRTEVVGWLGDALKVRVAAAPEGGKANAAVERLLAERLGVSRREVSVTKGRASPQKLVAVSGLSDAEVRRRLGG